MSPTDCQPRFRWHWDSWRYGFSVHHWGQLDIWTHTKKQHGSWWWYDIGRYNCYISWYEPESDIISSLTVCHTTTDGNTVKKCYTFSTGNSRYSAQECCITGCIITVLETTGGYILVNVARFTWTPTKRGSMENKLRRGKSQIFSPQEYSTVEE